ncbi:MAG TPA: hypothetical protein VM571_01555 [Noviherbaspirillum sp.]|nr:hypothetical protein [Noviherbaspirillum sp.]
MVPSLSPPSPERLKRISADSRHHVRQDAGQQDEQQGRAEIEQPDIGIVEDGQKTQIGRGANLGGKTSLNALLTND